MFIMSVNQFLIMLCEGERKEPIIIHYICTCIIIHAVAILVKGRKEAFLILYGMSSTQGVNSIRREMIYIVGC